MAYMHKDLKDMLAPQIKQVLKKYGAKGSISIRHHSTIVVTVRESALAFELPDYGFKSLSTYQTGENLSESDRFINELLDAMNGKHLGELQNRVETDIYRGYFDADWYVSIQIGNVKKPYKYTGVATHE